MSRYTRQEILPEVGRAGQAAFHKAHVLVVGAGGLSAPALQYLIGAGVGHLTLVDNDVVSLTNLHRQTLFREADVGKSKATVAAETLRCLNADCKISVVLAPLNPTNAQRLVAQSTLVLDCADSFAVSYILSDKCRASGVPLISASVLGVTGYVGGFCASAPSLRSVFPDLPDRAQNCATAGVLGPVVGMIGAAQAQMALGVLIRQTPSPLGQMISFDMENFRSSSFRFDGAPEPENALSFISPADIKESDIVFELRDEIESPIPVIETAVRSNVAEAAQINLSQNINQRTVFTCRSGLRAWQAATHLRSLWAGEISLIAMGDTPHSERLNT